MLLNAWRSGKRGNKEKRKGEIDKGEKGRKAAGWRGINEE